MTHNEKVEYMRIGLNLASIPCNDYTAEMIVELYEAIQVKKGEFTLADTVEIQRRVNQKYSIKNTRRGKLQFVKNKKGKKKSPPKPKSRL